MFARSYTVHTEKTLIKCARIPSSLPLASRLRLKMSNWYCRATVFLSLQIPLLLPATEGVTQSPAPAVLDTSVIVAAVLSGVSALVIIAGAVIIIVFLYKRHTKRKDLYYKSDKAKEVQAPSGYDVPTSNFDNSGRAITKNERGNRDSSEAFGHDTRNYSVHGRGEHPFQRRDHTSEITFRNAYTEDYRPFTVQTAFLDTADHAPRFDWPEIRGNMVRPIAPFMPVGDQRHNYSRYQPGITWENRQLKGEPRTSHLQNNSESDFSVGGDRIRDSSEGNDDVFYARSYKEQRPVVDEKGYILRELTILGAPRGACF